MILTIRKIYKLFLLTIILASCSSSVHDNVNRFRGYFSYMADAALFTDCSTNNKYPVLMEGEYIKLENAYLEIDKSPGEAILVEIIGEIELRTNMEGTGEREFLLVEKFIEIYPNDECK